MLIPEKLRRSTSLGSWVTARRWAVAAALAALVAIPTLAQDVVQQGGAPPSPPPQAAANGNGTKFIVQFTKATPRSSRAQIAQQAGASVRSDLSIIDAVAVTVPNQNVLTALMNNRNIKRVVPDRPLHEGMPPPRHAARANKFGCDWRFDQSH